MSFYTGESSPVRTIHVVFTKLVTVWKTIIRCIHYATEWNELVSFFRDSNERITSNRDQLYCLDFYTKKQNKIKDKRSSSCRKLAYNYIF